MTNLTRAPVLVTGGAGYIGSHTVLELLRAGYPVVVLDNLSNASPEALRRVERLTGAQAPLVRGDVRDEALLTDLETTFASRTTALLAGGHTDLDVEISVLRDRLKYET